MNRPRDAAASLTNVWSRLQFAAGDQRLVRAVIVAEIEIEIECDRVRDGDIVGLVAGTCMGPMRDEPGEHDRDEDAETSAVAEL